jgi:hypothetical protein
MIDRAGCVKRDDRGRRMHWKTRRRAVCMAMIVEEVDIVGNL